MTAECRPPPNTPDGTLAWFKTRIGTWACLYWHAATGRWWVHGTDRNPSPETLASWGWRYHSIAEPPASSGFVVDPIPNADIGLPSPPEGARFVVGRVGKDGSIRALDLEPPGDE